MTTESTEPAAPPAAGHLVVHIDYDHEAESPNDWDATGWKLYSFSQKHRDYKHWEELGITQMFRSDPPYVTKAFKRKLDAGLAHMVGYFEHGQCSWFLSEGSIPIGVEFQWDGVRYAGVIIWEGDAKHAPKKDDREQAAAYFAETFTSYANGRCYQVLVEDPAKEKAGEDADIFVSSSYYGEDDLEAALREEHCLDNRRVLLQGDAKGAISLSKCGVNVAEVDEDDLEEDDD